MILFHIFDLSQDGFLNCLNSSTAHTSRHIDAIHDGYVLCCAVSTSDLFLYLLIRLFDLRRRLDNVVDGMSFRLLLGININEVFVIAELAVPHLLILLYDNFTVHVEVPLTRLALDWVACSQLKNGIFQATHRNLENIGVYFLLEFLTLRYLPWNLLLDRHLLRLKLAVDI